MKPRFIVLLYLLLFVISHIAHSKGTFDKTEFYSAFSSENLELVDKQLSILKKSSFKEKKGFQGALLMKKAGLVGNLREKLNLFIVGHKKLEEAIKADPLNTEFRFLRLIIQENAPGILNYNEELEQDSIHIKKGFSSLPAPIQKVILDYSRKSEFLTSL